VSAKRTLSCKGPALLQRFGTPQEPAELLRYPLLMRDGADLVPKWEIRCAAPDNCHVQSGSPHQNPGARR
jgi:hypothetical protein